MPEGATAMAAAPGSPALAAEAGSSGGGLDGGEGGWAADDLYAGGAGNGAANGGAAAGTRERPSLVNRLRGLRQGLQEELDNYPVLQHMSEATGVRKIDLVSWAGVLFTLSAVAGLGARHWCELVGFAYPAVATMQTMAHNDSSAVVRWMTYWVTVAFLKVLEQALGPMLMRVVPFYFPFKFGFLVWSQSPQYRGSMLVHSHILAPFLKCHKAVAPQHVESM